MIFYSKTWKWKDCRQFNSGPYLLHMKVIRPARKVFFFFLLLKSGLSEKAETRFGWSLLPTLSFSQIWVENIDWFRSYADYNLSGPYLLHVPYFRILVWSFVGLLGLWVWIRVWIVGIPVTQFWNNSNPQFQSLSFEIKILHLHKFTLNLKLDNLNWKT